MMIWWALSCLEQQVLFPKLTLRHVVDRPFDRPVQEEMRQQRSCPKWLASLGPFSQNHVKRNMKRVFILGVVRCQAGFNYIRQYVGRPRPKFAYAPPVLAALAGKV